MHSNWSFDREAFREIHVNMGRDFQRFYLKCEVKSKILTQ